MRLAWPEKGTTPLVTIEQADEPSAQCKRLKRDLSNVMAANFQRCFRYSQKGSSSKSCPHGLDSQIEQGFQSLDDRAPQNGTEQLGKAIDKDRTNRSSSEKEEKKLIKM